MAPIRLFLARLRRDRLSAALLAVLVFVTAGLAAASPRLLNRAADGGVRYELATATSVERNLQLGRITEIGAAPGQGLAPVADVEASIEDAFPRSVRAVLSGDSWFAESVVWSVLDRPPTRPGFVTLRAQDGLDDHLTLVDGRMPSGEVEQVEQPQPPASSVPLPPGPRIGPLLEVAISTTTADELGVGIGDRMDMIPDTDDPLVGAFGFPNPAAVEVVGLYEVDDPAGNYWLGDLGLDQPTLVPVGINTVLVYATALVSPDAYPALTQLAWPMRFTFRYYVDPDRLDAGMLDRLVLDLRRMESEYASFATSPDPTRTTLQTGITGLLERFADEHRATEAVLVTAAIGPSAVAVVAIAVLALLAVRRRRPALVLVRGRGGSAPQVTAAHVVEGLLFTVAPAGLAAALVGLLVDARPTPLSSLLAGIVAAGTTLVLVAAAMPTALSPLRTLDRDGTAAAGPAGPRRLAFEALVVVLAVGGVVLLRQRGLAGGSAAGELAGVDPLLAAVPALVGLAVGIVTIRLFPYPVRAAGVLAGGSRGLTPALGLRRAERQAGDGHLPLIVLLLTVAIGTFSATMLATVDRGQVAASWEHVGAAHRVDAAGNGFASEVDLSSVPGVDAVAAVHRDEATVGLAGGTRTALLAIDAPEYQAVTAGTPIETTFPRAFLAEASDPRPGTTENPIPTIVSRALQEASTTSFRVGDTFQLTYQGRFATFVVSEIRERLPGIDAARPFVAVPRHLLAAGLIDRRLPATSLYVSGPADLGPSLRDALAGFGAGGTVTSQATELEELRERPLVQAVSAGFVLALVAALGYAALALVVSLLMSGAARAGETAHLRTLGLDGRQVLTLALLEHGPPVVVALVAGLALGIAVGWVVLPGLGLGAFTGAAVDPPLTVDIGPLVVVAGVLVGIVAIGVVLSAWAQRRVNPATAVREGIE